MKLRTTILATTAAAALAFGFSPQLLAQGAGTQAGASTSHSASGGQAGGSGHAAASSTNGQASANGGGARAQNGAGLKTEKTETGVKIGSTKIGSNGNATTVRERSRTRVSAYSSGRDDVILHRRRPHGMIVYNDQPSSRLIVRHRRPHDFVMYNNEPRRHVVVNERRPGVTISERTATRNRSGGEINVRTGERSREVTTGSASRTGPSQGSSASKQSPGSQAGGEVRASGGNAGKQPSTTGQATH
jgi:hypothetical protein